MSPRPDGCILCAAAAAGADDEHLVVCRTELAVVLLNRYPYNNGHLLLAPRRHLARLADLTPAENRELAELLEGGERALEAAYSPHGLNIGLNLGGAAGAGIEDHLHWHMVPRWRGDSNFMAVIGQTRVIPEDLAETLRKLRAGFGRR